MKSKFIYSFVIVSIMAIFGTAFKFQSEKLPDHYYPATLVVIEANHTENWTGNMICKRYSDYIRETENKIAYDFRYTINEDPEDIVGGDILSVIMYDNKTPEIADDIVIEYRYAY